MHSLADAAMRFISSAARLCPSAFSIRVGLSASAAAHRSQRMGVTKASCLYKYMDERTRVRAARSSRCSFPSASLISASSTSPVVDGDAISLSMGVRPCTMMGTAIRKKVLCFYNNRILVRGGQRYKSHHAEEETGDIAKRNNSLNVTCRGVHADNSTHALQ